MNDLGNLLQMIYDLLSGWFTSFTSHATAVMEKLNLIETDTASIKNSASDIKSNTDDIKDNTGAIITPVQSIKTNTDSIKTDTTSIKNNVSTMANQLGTISTNVGTASAFTEDVANNTLDIKNRIVTIGSDTTQLRSNSNTITSDVSDIKTALNYYLANTPVTEDVEGSICNIDTDLTDYLKACNVTIPADQTGYTGITLTKNGKNLVAPSNFVANPANFIWGYRNTGFLLRANITYTFSFNGTNCSSLRLVSVDEQTIYAQAPISSPYNVTYTPSVDTLVAFRLWGNGLTGTDFMLEVSNNATSHEPYKAITYPVSFGTTITDGAEINLLDGIIKVNSTPVSYLSVSPIAVRTYKGVNNIYSDVGTTALTYRESLKYYMDKQEA